MHVVLVKKTNMLEEDETTAETFCKLQANGRHL